MFSHAQMARIFPTVNFFFGSNDNFVFDANTVQVLDYLCTAHNVTLKKEKVNHA